jgi:hypothetical protein
MKVERKVSDFFAEKRKWNGNMERETELCETERKQNFLGENGNGNETTFSGGTDAETEFLFPTKVDIRFMIVLHA